jgi:Tfp pilus assembly protein PilX
MNRLSRSIRADHPERGLAATAAALLLFLAMGIIVAFTNRSLVFEQRTSANQYRYTKAFEAAEAGIEWAVASLNLRDEIRQNCRPESDATVTVAPTTLTASSFRGVHMSVNGNTGALASLGRSSVCVITATGYECSCNAAGDAALVAANLQGPAFKVQFLATDESGAALADGVARLLVQGCTSLAGNCHPAATGTPDGTAAVRVLLGVLPALGTAPAATITAKTDVTWGGSGAAVGVVNTDSSTNGITINAGGTVDEEKARITTIPGSPPSSSIIENDTSLSSISSDQMFQTFFGMTKAQFISLATSVTCPNNCSSTLEAAVNNTPAGETPIIYVTNDLDVNGNVSIGSTTNPVILVVNGNIHLNGTMDVFGMVYAASSTWDNTGGGSAFLRGAAVSEGAFTGNGTPDFYFDADVLKRLRFQPGAFMKIPGSWKDFNL